MISKKNFTRGVRLKPDNVAFDGKEGELKVDLASAQFQAYLGGASRNIVTEDQSQTLTNKTIDVDAQTSVINIANANIKAAAAIDASKIADGSVSNAEFQYLDGVTSAIQTQINTVSSAAGNAQTDINNHIADAVDAHDASAISNIPSGNLAATDIQSAVNELQSDIDTRATASALTAHITNATDAHDASAISNIPSGNLAATEVQAALNELQSDIDTRATSSALSSHTGASTGVHGVTGAVVGTSDAQTLTNKIITGADIRTPVRSDVKQDTLANLTTYALTASNGQLVFATDTKSMYQVVDTALVSVGSGGGGANVDAMLTQTFDSALLTDFTQTGLALSPSNPIDGTLSARLIHQSGSSQSFKQVKAVDRKYRGDLMQLSLQVRSSASEGNLTLLVTDETNSATLLASSSIQTSQYQVATAVTNATTTISGFSNVDINALKVGMTITGSGIPTATVISSINTTANTIVISQAATASATITAKFSALPELRTFSFTIPTNCASLSYTVTALQEAGLPESYIDDVVIQSANTALLSTSVTTPNLTAWQAYTPSFTGFGTPSAVEFEWRQVGENIEVRGKFASGTSTAVEARISLPNGYTSAGTSLIPSIQMVGKAAFLGSSATYFSSSVLIEPSVAYFTMGRQQSTVNELTKALGTVMAGSGDVISLFATIPVAGLSASSSTSIPLTQSALIQEVDSAIVLNTYNGYGSTATKIMRFTNLESSLGSDISYVDSATLGASFTALTAGIYNVSLQIDASTINSYFGISKNASSLTTDIGSLAQTEIVDFIRSSGAANYVYEVGRGVYCNAGDIIRVHTSGTVSGNTQNTKFAISKQGSLKQASINTNSKITIPTSELRFEGASARGSTDTAIVKFDTMAKIRGDAFSIVNTAANGTVITMLKAGKLNIASTVVTVGADALYITKNQAVLTAIPASSSEILSSSGTAVTTRGAMSWTGTTSIGDIIRICASANPASNIANSINLSFQEQEIQVSVSNTLPQFSESDSSVRVDTANGYGSTATMIRRFSNVRQNIGMDVLYADSATAGASFVAMESGTYSISYTDEFSAASWLGISKNASSLTTSIFALDISEKLASTYTAVSGSSSSCSWTGYLTAGDIIRAHTSSQATGANLEATFTMSKVGKPNVTGVNVTPFVNVPQPSSQNLVRTYTGGGFTGAISGALTSDTANGILSYNSTTGIFTALKSCTVDATFSAQNSAAVFMTLQVFKNGAAVSKADTPNTAGAFATTSATLSLAVGETLNFQVAGGTNNVGYFAVKATALASQILTAPETFSTDTASLTYAGSGTYTLATLANAPVGTFITFTTAINTNTKTQTTTAPTQTTSDMQSNGIRVFSRAYNAASTSASPAIVAIQVGKGMKGLSTSAYVSTSKTTPISIDASIFSVNATAIGTNCIYSELTGILYIDAGTNFSIANTSRAIGYDVTNDAAVTSGYFVINASKNPALTGMNISAVAASAIQTSAQSIPTSTSTTVTWDAAKTFDTHGALNAATGIYTAPESGYYQINAGVNYTTAAWTNGNEFSLYLNKNGSLYRILHHGQVQTTGSLLHQTNGSDVVFLTKGETVSIITNHNRGSSTALYVDGNYFSITKTSVG